MTAYLLCLYRDGVPVNVVVSPVQLPDGCKQGEQWVEICHYVGEPDGREHMIDLCARLDPEAIIDDSRKPAGATIDSYRLLRMGMQPLAVRRAIRRLGEERTGQRVLVSDLVDGLTPAARARLADALAATDAHAVMIVAVELRQSKGTSEMSQWRNPADVARIAELEQQLAILDAYADAQSRRHIEVPVARRNGGVAR